MLREGRAAEAVRWLAVHLGEISAAVQRSLSATD